HMLAQGAQGRANLPLPVRENGHGLRRRRRGRRLVGACDRRGHDLLIHFWGVADRACHEAALALGLERFARREPALEFMGLIAGEGVFYHVFEGSTHATTNNWIRRRPPDRGALGSARPPLRTAARSS